jgi:hypothetical protein
LRELLVSLPGNRFAKQKECREIRVEQQFVELRRAKPEIAFGAFRDEEDHFRKLSIT